ncbi:MFS transporter [Amycolatopsis jejuensis]|uniref:MFS transporter n=1 Tax=Amycolatopsis jejuensis TaxID=330084 RepID=UPI00068F01F2|nr:MFS transporter [Amycolatopsis jejuensis]
MAEATSTGTAHRPQHRRAAWAALIGQSIEYYDFYLYGTAAALVLGKLFFPSHDPAAGTLAAFATFAAGFLLRPVGAIVFGHLGDRVGRKSILVLTLMLMGGATMLIGFLPSYATIGVWAPILLVVLRCVQGFALGGEWGGASLVSVEHAPKGRAAFFGAIPQLGSPAGLMLSSLMVLMFQGMPDSVFLAWGWRVPFLFSGILLVVGLVIRLRLQETPAFEKVKKAGERSRVPLLDVLRLAWRPLLIGIAAAMLTSGGYYLVNTFTITYAVSKLGLSSSIGLAGQLITAAVQASLILVVGRWATYRKPRLIACIGSALVAAWAFPLYALLNTGTPGWIWFAQAVATMFQTGLWAVLPALLANQFPTHLRYTGISLCYQGASLIGGFTPAIATFLLAQTNASWPVATLLLGLGVVSALGCAAARRSSVDAEPNTTVAVNPARA